MHGTLVPLQKEKTKINQIFKNTHAVSTQAVSYEHPE